MQLSEIDTQIANLILQEERRQCTNINLIASENYPSKAVLQAQGSALTNKYAEGYPRRRYYGGCENVDEVEQLALKRVRELFGAEHANVQPYSGSVANMAAYISLISVGDSIMGMRLEHGGHLTHGSPVSFSGKLYHSVFYGIDRDTELIDYDEVERTALREKPKVIIAGSSSYPQILDYQRFRSIADKVGAKLIVDIAHEAGLVAAGVHPSPVPYADVVTSTTHKTLRGPRGGLILCKEKYGPSIDHTVFPGLQGGPLMHTIAAKAVAFLEASQLQFIAYQKAVLDNAKVLASELMAKGLRLVTGGTSNHRILVDLRKTGITGREAEKALDKSNITANKNSIPFDPNPPNITSGLRLGTPAITSQGLGPDEVKRIARLIVDVLLHIDDERTYQSVSQEIQEMIGQSLLPGISK